MTYLKLTDLTTGESWEFRTAAIRIGRDPDFELVPTGVGSEVVSGDHARAVYRDGRWWVEDSGSRNGTFVDEVRLAAGSPVPLDTGSIVKLGVRGPQYRVDAVADRRVAETLVEEPTDTAPDDVTVPLQVVDASHPPAAAPGSGPAKPAPSAPTIELTVIETRTGDSFKATGGRIRIGRGTECEMRPVGADDTSVSRVHTEIVLRPDGKPVVRDARSKNGTLVNDAPLEGEREIARGDRIGLGPQGPELRITILLTPAIRAAAAAEKAAAEKAAAEKAAAEKASVAREAKPSALRAIEKVDVPRRSFGGKGATMFFSDLFQESSRKAARRVRVAVWSAVGVLAVAVAGLVWYKGHLERGLEAQLEKRLAQQQSISDSIRAAAEAEYARLRDELDQARAGSAPASVLDSLRTALSQAEDRTAALERALTRAQGEVRSQLAAADSSLRASQAEQRQLQAELDRARSSNVSDARVDSLLRAVSDAESRTKQISAQMQAVQGQGNTLAVVAQANQSAVGLVTSYIGNEIDDGSGFAITPSGYFVTNRHVVHPRDRPEADSVFVTMADQKTQHRATVVAEGDFGATDLAVLKVSSHDGSAVSQIDWSGAHVRQGDPAALIGFPAGLGNALDPTGAVRTAMTAGIFSKVTSDAYNFDGFTIGGSSGSPIFNAEGEVVAVHRAGLSEAVGFGFAVPIAKLIPLLPPEAKAQLGLH